MTFQIILEKQHVSSAYPGDIAHDFCNLYYPLVSTRGMSSVINMFDPNVSCNLNGTEFTGIHNVVVKLAESGISRLMYDRISCIYQCLSNDTLLLQITGLCQGISHYNTFTQWMPFSETFVIKCYYGNKGNIVNYIFKFL